MDQPPAQSIDIPQPADSDWSTAPNTPRHSVGDLQDLNIEPITTAPNQDYQIDGKHSNYTQAVKESDWYWEWHTSEADFERELSTDTTQNEFTRAHSIDVEPGLPVNRAQGVNGEDKQGEGSTEPRTSSFFCIPTGGLMSSSYPPVSLSCTTTTSAMHPQLQATDPNDLPGNVPGGRGKEHDVITTPPQGGRSRSSSASSLKPRSIQEMGQLLSDYVPAVEVKVNPKSPSTVNHKEDEDFLGPFCMSYKAKGAPPMEKETENGTIENHKEVDDVDVLDEDTPHTILLPPTEDTVTKTPSLTAYADFLKSQTCYSIIPSSTKIVVLDTRLRVKKAFFALVANGIRSAPLWDSRFQEFVGMLTITDFIRILRYHYKSPIVRMDELEEQTIQEWTILEKDLTKLKTTLVSIDPMESLYVAISMLVKHKIHRLPIIDQSTGNAIYVLTHKRILHHLYHNVICGSELPMPAYMHKSIGELEIGTYSSIATASQDTAIIAALNVFAERRVSALPIVSPDGEVIDIYAKFDVINLAAERTYNNLDVSLRDALKHRAQGFEGVQTCMASDSLLNIITKIVSAKVHRLVIVNSRKHVVGVVSLSDILKFLILTEH